MLDCNFTDTKCLHDRELSKILTRRWRVKSWCWHWSGPRGQPSETKTTKSPLPFTPPSSPLVMSLQLRVPRPSPTMRFLTHPMVIRKPFLPSLLFFFLSINQFFNCWFFRCLLVHCVLCADEVSVDHWNELNDEYAFVYANPEKGSEKVLVKCLVMNDKLLVHALTQGSSEPLSLEIE